MPGHMSTNDPNLPEFRYNIFDMWAVNLCPEYVEGFKWYIL